MEDWVWLEIWELNLGVEITNGCVCRRNGRLTQLQRSAEITFIDLYQHLIGPYTLVLIRTSAK